MNTDDWADELRRHVKQVLPAVREFRHTLHQEPEIGLLTTATRAAVAAKLAGTAVRVRPPLLEADLIGELPGRSGRTICLRADMDALPIVEATGLPYQSRRPGAMHACGHDGNTAVLTGTALVLDHFRDRLPVTVRFIFQPGEEIVCGGRDLVARGACDNAEAAFALHGYTGLPVGCVATRQGPLFAAGGFFRLVITGKGCHGSQPESGNNPILCVAALIRDLQACHRTVNASDGAVLSVCTLQAGEATNTIPDTAAVAGTYRFLTTEAGDRIEAAIREAAAAQAAASGTQVAVTCERPYALPVLNTAAGFARVRAAARAVLPESQWREWPKPSMGNEDFAYYLRDREGAMFFVGMGERSASLHSPNFDFNDDALEAGMLTMAAIALSS